MRGASHELFAAALAEALYQHVELLAYVLGVRLCRQLGLQLYHLCQAAQLNLLRYVVGQVLRCVCAGALAVFEHEGRVVAHLAHQRERHLVVFLSLAVVAHEYVGRYGAVGYYAAYGPHAVHIPLSCIFAVHQLQYAV